MAFVVSARKYRPTRFEDVVGQEHVSQTLKKALQTGHVAHAFLFCGSRGVGKTTCARILAKVLNCENVSKEFEPCGECGSCRAFHENASFNIIELDAASNNSVDNIRALVEQVRFQPQQGKYKVFIIDEVHMLSQSAFNAFLKTLEEPPPHAIFILATTEKHKIIPTILSRCQVYDFKRIQVRDIKNHLQKICELEGIQAEGEALHIIAQKADGALRDALSIFDRIVSSSGEKITYDDVIANLNVLDYDYFFRFTDALLTEDLQSVLLIFDDILRNGFEGDHFIYGLAGHFRNLLICKSDATLQLLEAGEALSERYRQQAAAAPSSFLLSALNLCNECDVNYKMARAKRLHVEMTLIKMCYIGKAIRLAKSGQSLPDFSEKKIAELKSGGSALRKEIPIQQAFVANIPVKQEVAASPSTKSDKEEKTETEAENRKGEVHEGGLTPEKAIDFLKETEGKQDAATEPAPDEQAKGEAQTSVLRQLKSSRVPTLRSLDALNARVEETEAKDQDAKKEIQLSLENLTQAWEAYVSTLDNSSAKTILRGASYTIEGEDITVVVGSALAESTIRLETELINFLRKKLYTPKLGMHIRLDPSRSNAAPARPKKLTDSEKYMAMKAINPLVDDIRKRFDLSLDPDE